MPQSDITLSAQPDGFGFHYGMATIGEKTQRVDVMPPLPHWHGQFILPDYEPHPVEWIIYLDGEEVARATRKEDLSATIQQRLITSRP